MFTDIKRCLAALPIVLAASAGSALAAPNPLGTWIDHTGRGAVEITDCNGALCGRIVWLKSAGDEEACGMQIIGNVKPVAGGKWDGGWIYDPEAKAKYDVEITPLGEQKLKILGYAGMKMLGETMTWTRAPADLKRCGKPEAAKPEAQPPVRQAEPRPADPVNPPAAAPEAETNPPATKPERQASPDRPPVGGRQARAKECTIQIPELGKLTFPCSDIW
jgi:uncharacterized protein (DUF2147 family)